jgi:hypothetical protein
MEIENKHLIKWKKKSLEIARKLGYDPNILNLLDKNLVLELNNSKIPKGMWFGWAHYDDKYPKIEVYTKNLSCEDIPNILNELRAKGVPDKTVWWVAKLLRIVPRKIFFSIYNQSGMDHELIGHLYNHQADKKHNERAAVDVQLEFAKARSGWLFHRLPWKVISYFAPIILHHHKKDEF